jgi:glycogen operon protein
VSTHDLPTLAGWWTGADIREKHALGLRDAPATEAALVERAAEKAMLLDLLRREGLFSGEADPALPLPDAVAAAVHGFVCSTPALLALVQADDLAGETVAVNLPGTDRERPNWRRRLDADVAGLFQTGLARVILAAMGHRAAKPPDAG